MKMKKKRVLMVGSAEESGGGVASVIRLMKKMPFWRERRCGWLGTQIQRNYLWKMWYALKAAIVAPFVIWKYDIVHFHTTPDRNGLLIQLPMLVVAKLYRKKTIVHIHMGSQLEDHTENKFFLWWMRKADVIVLLANKWKDLFNCLFANVDTLTTVVYNACEQVDDIDITEKENMIALMAYMIEDKGVDVMLNAWQLIHLNYPEWKVYMMGSGNVDYYKNKSYKMGLGSSVIFTGYVRGDERESILRKASVFVMCSYNEGFPMSVLEAWSYGMSVITTPVGGLPDVIEDTKDCLVFNFGDADMLAQKLRLVIDDEQLRNNMVFYAKQKSENIFSIESVNKCLDYLYNRL